MTQIFAFTEWKYSVNNTFTDIKSDEATNLVCTYEKGIAQSDLVKEGKSPDHRLLEQHLRDIAVDLSAFSGR